MPNCAVVARTNLAVSLTRFVGRDRDLARVCELFAHGRLLTVVGPPGVGKTRLSREYARQLAREGATHGDVWFCDLSQAFSAEEVMAVIGSVLGIQRASATLADRVAEIGQTLAARPPALLVLDNVEQLLPDASAWVERWLAADDRTRWLVTSRRPLRIAAESVFELDTLSQAEALELFVERVRLLLPGFELGAHDAGSVEQLVDQLDGLPLAIELAAARMRLLDPRQALDKLSQRFQLLTTSSLSERKATTLFRTIESSWLALSDVERSALAQCALFRGAFELAAAEAIVDVSGVANAWLVDVLEALHEQSLIVVEQRAEGRVMSLLLSIRDFVLAVADEPTLAAARARHARYFAERMREAAAKFSEGGDPRALAPFERDRANLLAAHEALEQPSELIETAGLLANHAGALSYQARRELLERAIARGDEPAPEALEARGNVARFAGQIADSERDFRELCRIAEERRDQRLLGRALAGLANARAAEVRWDDARELYQRALEADPDRKTVGRVSAMIAATWFNQDEPERARELLLRALDVARESGDGMGAAIATTSLGIVATALADHAAARAFLGEALELTALYGLAHWQGLAASYLAVVAHDAGKTAEARVEYEHALQSLRDVGVRRAEAVALAHYASCLIELGELAAARAAAEAASRLHSQTSPDQVGWALALLGAIAALGGERARADQSFERARRALAEYRRPALSSALEIYASLAGDHPTAASAERRRSVEVRIAERIVGAHFAERRRRGDPQLRLVMGPRATWFRAPGADAPAKLYRRKSLQRVLFALADHRSNAPGVALPISDLVARGWPGERILPSAGAERVYAAVASLRKLGLRQVLLQRDDGYLLDPRVELEMSKIVKQ